MSSPLRPIAAHTPTWIASPTTMARSHATTHRRAMKSATSRAARSRRAPMKTMRSTPASAMIGIDPAHAKT